MNAQSQPAKQLTIAEIVRNTGDAVVQIVVFDESGKEFALGSGFIVSADGKIVTNYHVIEGAQSAVAKLSNGAVFPVDGVLAADPDKDLAVLKVDGKGLPFLKIASTESLHVGDHVVAIGSPLGLEGTVSDGIVSAMREESPRKNWIQTTAPVSHGNSGGPLLNMDGSVIGVITWGVNTEQGQNLNFAIPSDEVNAVLFMPLELSALESVAKKLQSAAVQPVAAPEQASSADVASHGPSGPKIQDVRTAKESQEQAARDEAAGVIWTDPTTGLTWTKRDNGFDLDWKGATQFCGDLDLGGHTDWRLPTIEELAGLYDKAEHFHGHHIKGKIRLTGCYSCLEELWSGTPSKSYGEERLFNFDLGERHTFPRYENHGFRALCVRQ